MLASRGFDMKRRGFITLVGGAAAAWPLAALAQDAGKTWRIAFIAHVPTIIYEEPLFDDLRELGYVEGQNIIIERRYAEGRPERFQEFAGRDEFELKADLIITTTTPAALAARNATTTIPIVVPTRDRPSGHWADRPKSLLTRAGNITGGAILSWGTGGETAAASQGSGP